VDKETGNFPRRLKCGRCGVEIVGVVPKWDDRFPVCRMCAYSGPIKSPLSKRRHKGKGENTRESQVGNVHRPFRYIPFLLLSGIAALLIILALSEHPHFILKDVQYSGAAELDAGGRECVHNLRVISGALQEAAISWPQSLCPASGKPYKVRYEKGDIIVDCPEPERHGVTRLWVSLKASTPRAEP